MKSPSERILGAFFFFDERLESANQNHTCYSQYPFVNQENIS